MNANIAPGSSLSSAFWAARARLETRSFVAWNRPILVKFAIAFVLLALFFCSDFGLRVVGIAVLISLYR